MGEGPDQEDSDASVALSANVPNATCRATFLGRGRLGAGRFPLHSPLLGESWLVSFPPLSDMLKFSG